MEPEPDSCPWYQQQAFLRFRPGAKLSSSESWDCEKDHQMVKRAGLTNGEKATSIPWLRTPVPLLKLPNVWSFWFWLVWNGLSHQFHWFWLRLLTNMFISFFSNSASSCSLWKSMRLLHCLAAFLRSTLGCLEQLQFNSVKKKVGNCDNFRWSFNGQSIGKPYLTGFFYFYHQILTCRQYHMIV